MSRKSGSDGEEVKIAIDSVEISGNLGVPPHARGIVLFAHGSGSSRSSPRNRAVATVLRSKGLATLLLDLLTPEEEKTDAHGRRLRFDIGLLAERLVEAADWISENPGTQRLRIGYFGASTGSAAALVAAAERPDIAAAVVSRGGRPDLAGPVLARVEAPTLLIVGKADTQVLELNREALAHLRVESRLEVVPRATHLFPEPGALERVSEMAGGWFLRYMRAGREVQGLRA